MKKIVVITLFFISSLLFAQSTTDNNCYSPKCIGNYAKTTWDGMFDVFYKGKTAKPTADELQGCWKLMLSVNKATNSVVYNGDGGVNNVKCDPYYCDDSPKFLLEFLYAPLKWQTGSAESKQVFVRVNNIDNKKTYQSSLVVRLDNLNPDNTSYPDAANFTRFFQATSFTAEHNIDYKNYYQFHCKVSSVSKDLMFCDTAGYKEGNLDAKLRDFYVYAKQSSCNI